MKKIIVPTLSLYVLLAEGMLSALPMASTTMTTAHKKSLELQHIDGKQEQPMAMQPLSEEHQYFKDERDGHKKDGGASNLVTARKLNEKLLLEAVQKNNKTLVQEYLSYDPRPSNESIEQAYMLAKENEYDKLANYLKDIFKKDHPSLGLAEAQIAIAHELRASGKVTTAAAADKIAKEIVDNYEGERIATRRIPDLIEDYFKKLSLFKKLTLK